MEQTLTYNAPPTLSAVNQYKKEWRDNHKPLIKEYQKKYLDKHNIEEECTACHWKYKKYNKRAHQETDRHKKVIEINNMQIKIRELELRMANNNVSI